MHGALYMNIFANVQMYVQLVYKDSFAYAVYTHPSSKHLESLILCFLVFSAAAPSDRLAAVRIEGIKGEVNVMSKAAGFHLSQLRTSTSTGWVWRRSGVRQLPDSTLTPRWARWKNSTNMLHR